MVTVSLSDLQSNPDETSEETIDGKLANSNPLDRPQEAIESQPEPIEQETDNVVDGADGKEDSTDCQAETIASPVAALQDEEDETKSLHSSSGSDSVDWDELDKTEEQEPRSEATDEVSLIGQLTTMILY